MSAITERAIVEIERRNDTIEWAINEFAGGESFTLVATAHSAGTQFSAHFDRAGFAAVRHLFIRMDPVKRPSDAASAPETAGMLAPEREDDYLKVIEDPHASAIDKQVASILLAFAVNGIPEPPSPAECARKAAR